MHISPGRPAQGGSPGTTRRLWAGAGPAPATTVGAEVTTRPEVAGRWGRRLRTVDRFAGGYPIDIALYGLSALFAVVTSAASTLAPHRAWGTVATVGYALATAVALTQWASWRVLVRHRGPSGSTSGRSWSDPRVRLVTRLTGATARFTVTVAAWLATAVLPLLVQAVQRAGGRADRAQEEVLVIEDGGRRLIETGTPYLSRAEIAALPEPDRLLGYLPYQPGMALFGLPGAHAETWWSDARLWFALATAFTLGCALIVLIRAGAGRLPLVRATQVATVLPVCALTLATGGDDLPVLALCLLGLALAATGRFGRAGLALGAASALKLIAVPVAVVLAAQALTRSRRTGLRFAAGAVGLPVLTALPALIVNAGAMVENVFRFPLGHGLVTSPAASPLPGHLVATWLPHGRSVALTLLLLAGASIAVWLVRRPPRTAAATALVCGIGLLAAIALLPATRFGYLLYPIAFLVWARALLLPEPAGRLQ